MNCPHNNLIAFDDFTGVNLNITHEKSNVVGMLTWKKYSCTECKNIITVLQAVIEKAEENKSSQR